MLQKNPHDGCKLLIFKTFLDMEKKLSILKLLLKLISIRIEQEQSLKFYFSWACVNQLLNKLGPDLPGHSRINGHILSHHSWLQACYKEVERNKLFPCIQLWLNSTTGITRSTKINYLFQYHPLLRFLSDIILLSLTSLTTSSPRLEWIICQ